MSELSVVPLSEIRENKSALRAVRKDSEAYLELVESIRDKGVMNSITVRRAVDSDTKEEYYELIDGLHRTTAARDAGLESIPANILTANDAEVLEYQIAGNLQRVDTTPTEYTMQLRRMLNMNPMMTLTDLAAKINKSVSWVQDRLSLRNISNETISALIDSGDICLSNAFILAKLPEEEQVNFVESAQTMEAGEFVPLVQDRIKQIRDAVRKGREAAPPEFNPQAHLRRPSEMKEELTTGEHASVLLSHTGVTDPHEAFLLAVKWAMNLDPMSVEIQRAKWEQREAEKAERKAKRDAERKAKAAEKAKAAADKAEAEAEAANEVL